MIVLFTNSRTSSCRLGFYFGYLRCWLGQEQADHALNLESSLSRVFQVPASGMLSHAKVSKTDRQKTKKQEDRLIEENNWSDKMVQPLADAKARLGLNERPGRCKGSAWLE